MIRETLRAVLALVVGIGVATAADLAVASDTPTEWPIVYTTKVRSVHNAHKACTVRISTNGAEWPQPVRDYVWVPVDPACDASGLDVHDNVTRNNAGQDQR